MLEQERGSNQEWQVERESVEEGEYVIGVDGGGSKTLVVIVDSDGREVGRGIGGSANQEVVGCERAASAILEAVERARQSAGYHNRIGKRAWLGLSGVDRPEDILKLQPYVKGLAQEVRITNDAYLLLGALKEQVGIALIAGTGSIALGKNREGESVRAGGWGHVFGDEGSGYVLACQALQVVARAADGRGPQTQLLDEILRFWNLARAEQLLGEVYRDENKGRIAKLSSVLMQMARQGDVQALEIVQRGAQELALLVKAVSGQLGLQKVALALGGGLLLHEPMYRQLVLEEVQRERDLEQIVLVEDPALSAARALIEEGR